MEQKFDRDTKEWRERENQMAREKMIKVCLYTSQDTVSTSYVSKYLLNIHKAIDIRFQICVNNKCVGLPELSSWWNRITWNTSASDKVTVRTKTTTTHLRKAIAICVQKEQLFIIDH